MALHKTTYIQSIDSFNLGEIFTWGLNNYGQLGQGDFKARPYGTKVKVLSKEFCIDISAGLCHCLALNEKGQVFSWGFKQAEEGEPIMDRFKNVIDYENKGCHQTLPRMLKSIMDDRIKSVVCGGSHSLILSEKGEMYSWGDCTNGELGQGKNLDVRFYVNSVTPKKIEALFGKNIVRISAGENHSIVIAKDEKGEEEIWSWGCNKDGQCGVGDFENRLAPGKVKKSWKGETKGVSCGKSHSLFLTKENEVYGCGETKNGAFGDKRKEEKRVNVPMKVELGMEIKEGTEVVAGNNVSAILFR